MRSPIDEKVIQALNNTTEYYCRFISNRNAKLFTHFLPLGYQETSLSSVLKTLLPELIIAKSHIGILITLFDDFADNPNRANPVLLKELYKIPFTMEQITTSHLNSDEKNIIKLATHIANEFMKRIQLFPCYPYFKIIFEFDLKQFYNCNQFCEMITAYPEIMNVHELRLWGPFNMGMVLTGIVDLMASPSFISAELGKIREFLHLAQRFGKICNLLMTLSREIKERDYTNEVVAIGLGENIVTKENIDAKKFSPILSRFHQERLEILTRLKESSDHIHSFNGYQYIDGLKNFQDLHEQFMEEPL